MERLQLKHHQIIRTDGNMIAKKLLRHVCSRLKYDFDVLDVIGHHLTEDTFIDV